MKFINVKINATYYCNIILHSLFPKIFKRTLNRFVYFQDNVKTHTLAVGKRFYDANGIFLRKRTSQSLNLSFFEIHWEKNSNLAKKHLFFMKL